MRLQASVRSISSGREGVSGHGCGTGIRGPLTPGATPGEIWSFVTRTQETEPLEAGFDSFVRERNNRFLP